MCFKGIPTGVAYNSDGTVNETNSDLKGNQFVWIPCTVDEYKKTSWGKQSASWESNTDNGEIVYIQKYGGFYIGRYEAGTSNLTSSKIDFSKGYSALDWQNTNFRAEYITSGRITCKAGEIPYYHADYTTAQTMTKAMYATDSERKDSVYSGLATGTIWGFL